MNISVIIPVYNVEKYVERCVRSIIYQTYTESVECIIVNDCTPDKSMTIVKKLVADYKGQIRFKLLCHEQNRGLAAVRNTGLAAATGDYIIHIDSDDYCEPDMLEKMYTKALEEDADIVVADYWGSYPGREIYRAQIMPKAGEYAKALLLWKVGAMVWNKLVRRDFLSQNGLISIEGIDMGEDLLLVHRMFFYARKVVHLPTAVLHHIHYNMASYCQNRTRKSFDDAISVEIFIENFYREVDLAPFLHKELLLTRMNNWVIFLSYSRGKLQKEWNARYSDITLREIVKYYPMGPGMITLLLAGLNLLPVLNRLVAIKQKIFGSDAKHTLFTE